MSGRGKSGKSGKGVVSKRHKKQSGGSEGRIGNPAMKRLARRAGVSRVAVRCMEKMNEVAANYLEKLLDNCRAYCMHGKRKTINCSDVIYSLKRVGVKYMGY
jgi:histone H4